MAIKSFEERLDKKAGWKKSTTEDEVAQTYTVETKPAQPAKEESVQPAGTASTYPDGPLGEQTPSLRTPVASSMEAGMKAAGKLSENPIGVSGVEWRDKSYQEAVKTRPDLTPIEYMRQSTAYRRQNGMPEIPTWEVMAMFSGKDMDESEEERLKRERRERSARIVSGVGSMLGHLVNYARARGGHAAMRLDSPEKAYSHIRQLEEGRRKIAAQKYDNYVEAYKRKQADRAAEDLRKAAEADRLAKQKAAEREYGMKVAELQLKIDEAESKKERDAAQAKLDKLKFDETKRVNSLKLQETERHNRAVESVGGSGRGRAATSARNSDGVMMTRSSGLSKEEAMQLSKIYAKEYPEEFDTEAYRQRTKRTADGTTVETVGDVDWYAMASDILASGRVPRSQLEQMGYTMQSTENKEDKYGQYRMGKEDWNQYVGSVK